MKILALESSAKAASAAITEDGRLVAQYYQSSGLTHSRTLLLMTEELLKDTCNTIGDIDILAVARGPGSFTGIRIGVAAVKGLAWAAEKPVCGVSTLEAMAFQCAGYDGIVCPVMDAKRGQIYNAKFRIAGETVTRLCPDRAISILQLAEESKNDGEPYIFVGDGAELCYNTFSEEKIHARLMPQPLRLQTAYGVAAAADPAKAAPSDDLTPNYLRLSQAERERLAREGKTK